MIRFGADEETFRPTRVQHHLLRAALLDDREAVIASLREWKAAVDLADVEYGSQRMLPLLYRNLQRLGIADDALPRLKGIYRQVWFRNQLVLEQGVRAVRALRDAGIPVILLKGAALATSVYAELALRPMEDVDLLVPPEHFARAAGIARELGWRLYPALRDAEAHFAMQHAVSFRRDGQGELDLHRAAISDRFDEAGERALWERAKPSSIEGALMLDRADQLLQVCAHATQRNRQVSPIRWVGDAWFLLQDPAFDWQRVVDLARLRGLSFTLLQCLEYLRDGLGVHVPVIDALRRDATWLQRFALHCRASGGRLNYVHSLAIWLRLVRAGAGVRMFVRYIRSYYGVPANVPLPLFVAYRIVRGPRPQKLA